MMKRYSPTIAPFSWVDEEEEPCEMNCQALMAEDPEGQWVLLEDAENWVTVAERSIARSQEECFDRLRAVRALRLVFERLESALGIELDDDVGLNELLDIAERRIRGEVVS